MDIKEQKKKYFASFLWKLTVAVVIISVVAVILGIPIPFFTAFMEAFAKGYGHGMDTAVMNITQSAAFKSFSASVTYIFVAISDICGLIFLILTTKKTSNPPEKRSMKFGWWLLIYICCFGIGFIFTIVGSIVNMIFLLPVGFINAIGSMSLTGTTYNVAQSLIYADNSWAYIIIGIIIVGFVVPVLEEMIFRKLVIDNTSRYGFGAAVMISAFTFAVFHGNFSQFFYAFALGLLFAYIYSYTGKIQYTIFLHMAYNLYSCALLPITKKMIPESFSSVMNYNWNLFMEMAEKYPNDAKMLEMAYNRLFLNVSQYISLHPLALIGVFIHAGCILLFIFIALIGIILCFVNIKKGLNVRNSMMMGENGTKRCAAMNYGAILFYVFAFLFFSIYYGVQYLNAIIALLGKLF